LSLSADNEVDVSNLELLVQCSLVHLGKVEALDLKNECIKTSLNLLSGIRKIGDSCLEGVVDIAGLSLVYEPLKLLLVLSGVRANCSDNIQDFLGVSTIKREAIAAVPGQETCLEVAIGHSNRGGELSLVLGDSSSNLRRTIAGSDGLGLDLLNLGLNLGEGHATLANGITVVSGILRLVARSQVVDDLRGSVAFVGVFSRANSCNEGSSDGLTHIFFN